MSFASRQPNCPSRSIYCSAQTRRSSFTAGTSRNQDSSVATSRAASSLCPSAPITAVKAKRAWSVLGRGVILDPLAIALIPLRRCPGLEPFRGDHGQGVQRRPQRLADPLQTIEYAHGGQHMGGIGSLSASLLEQPQFAHPL